MTVSLSGICLLVGRTPHLPLLPPNAPQWARDLFRALNDQHQETARVLEILAAHRTLVGSRADQPEAQGTGVLYVVTDEDVLEADLGTWTALGGAAVSTEEAAGGGAASTDDGGPFLRLDASNDPVTGPLEINVDEGVPLTLKKVDLGQFDVMQLALHAIADDTSPEDRRAELLMRAEGNDGTKAGDIARIRASAKDGTQGVGVKDIAIQAVDPEAGPYPVWKSLWGAFLNPANSLLELTEILPLSNNKFFSGMDTGDLKQDLLGIDTNNDVLVGDETDGIVLRVKNGGDARPRYKIGAVEKDIALSEDLGSYLKLDCSNDPLTGQLDIDYASNPQIHIHENGRNVGDYFEFIELGYAGQIKKRMQAGVAYLFLDPYPGDGTSNAEINLFQGTNTTGGHYLNFRRGGNSVHVISSFGAVFNDVGGGYDTRIESLTDSNCFLVDASADCIGIGTSSPSAKLDINSDILRLRTSKTPASESAAGNQGDHCWDSDGIYVATAANAWKKARLEGFDVGKSCRVNFSSADAISSGSATVITWDGEDWDDASYWAAGSPTRLTIPSAGRYRISAQMALDSGGRTGYVLFFLRKNGAAIQESKVSQYEAVPGGLTTCMQLELVSSLSASDYIEVVVYHTFGVSIDTSSQGSYAYIERIK